MSTPASPPPTNPDIKRELKKQLLTMSARSFEFFAGEFLVYVGLEAVSVTRYIGDGGIDAQGSLVAGVFRIPVGVQVKRHKNNVQRPVSHKQYGNLHRPVGPDHRGFTRPTTSAHISKKKGDGNFPPP